MEWILLMAMPVKNPANLNVDGVPGILKTYHIPVALTKMNEKEVRATTQKRLKTMSAQYFDFLKKVKRKEPDTDENQAFHWYVLWRVAQLHAIVETQLGRKITPLKPNS